MIYKPGKYNLNADALSRNIQVQGNECKVLTRNQAKKEKVIIVENEHNTLENINILFNERNYENCLKYMQDNKEIYVSNLAEKSISQYQINNEIIFVMQDAVILLKTNMFQHYFNRNYIFYMIENGYYKIYIVMDKSNEYQMDFEQIFKTMSIIRNFLLEKIKKMYVSSKNQIQN